MTTDIWQPGSALVNATETNTTEEHIVASSGQTDFILLVNAYSVGTNGIAVYRNGQRLVSGVDYTETNTTTITLTSNLPVVTGELFTLVVSIITSSVTLAQAAATSATASATSAASSAANAAASAASFTLATQAEAEAGTQNTHYMSPLRVWQAIAKYLTSIVTQPANDNSSNAASTAYVDRAINNKNLVINGDFRIAQRGASQALTTTPAYGSVDRWAFYQNGSANGVAAQVASGLAAFQNAFKLGRTAGSALTGTLLAQTAFESNECTQYQGKTVTLSFWARAGANFSAAGSQMNVILYSGTGIDQSLASMGAWTGVAQAVNSNQAITTGWVKYSFTVTLGSTITQLGLALSYIPVGTAGADDNLYGTGVQIEQSPVATNFEYRSYSEELRRCQRYFWKGIGGKNLNPTAGTANVGVQTTFPVTMRTTPTVIASGTIAYTNADCVVGYGNVASGAWADMQTVTASAEI